MARTVAQALKDAAKSEEKLPVPAAAITRAFIVMPRAMLDQRLAEHGTDKDDPTPVLPPWSELWADAERGAYGLRIVTSVPVMRPRKDGEYEPGWDDWDSIAFVREGDKYWPKDTTLLYQQNWGKGE